jgi:phosphatidylserine/phosphatidylglycerophosphate/cardiolipin synthase-like enzyme
VLPPALEARIRHAARVVAPDHLRRIARALEPFSGWSGAGMHAAQRAVSAPPSRRFAAELCEEWRSHAPDAPGVLLAVALSAAAGVHEDARKQLSLEPVWSGPATQAVPLRLTASVLQEVIRASSESLLLVSFATYRVPEVYGELLKAAARNVRIRMVVETPENSGGRLVGGDLDVYRQVPGLNLYTWSFELRPSVGPGVAAMHAKAAVADAALALVGSANLTRSAQSANMELGLLVRGGELPLRLARHFGELIAQGVLAPA